MNPIEAAAREIASHCEHKSEADITAIITRHLFPVVEPEDVQPLTWYWVCDKGSPITIRMSDRDAKQFNGFEWEEIRGPIPMTGTGLK